MSKRIEGSNPSLSANFVKGEAVERSVCIVTPDFEGPIQNGGIGTFAKALANLWSSEPIKLTVFFTGTYEAVSRKSWQKMASRLPFQWVDLESEGCHARCPQSVSLAVYQYLKKKSFDQIHFQDWRANGFIPIRAKRMGLAFQETLLSVTLHSPSRWVAEGSGNRFKDPLEEEKLDFQERYAIEHADRVLSPSYFLIDWVQRQGWRIAEKRSVLRCLIPVMERQEGAWDASHLAFFGRLEARKGLDLFCEALEGVQGIRMLTFLGKQSDVYGEPSASYLRRWQARWLKQGVKVRILDTLSKEEAHGFLKKEKPLVVIPSRQDNYPYAVLEMAEMGIPIIASRVGGVVEMLQPHLTFEPNVQGLRGMLDVRHEVVTRPARGDWGQAHEMWRALLQEKALVSHSKEKKQPTITVCIPHYNYGAFLEGALASLVAQTDPPDEVIVIDDGSLEAASIDAFQKLRDVYTEKGWIFETQSNQGIGFTRNKAARLASSDYICFMDADNLADPCMIQLFRKSLFVSECEILTCHYASFHGPNPSLQVAMHTPLGPCVDVGFAENIFGDANACFKRSYFLEKGGFTEDRHLSFEDWELFASLALQGAAFDVVPEVLFYYRSHANGFSKITSQKQNRDRVLRSYRRFAPQWFQSKGMDWVFGIIEQSKLKEDSYARLGFPTLKLCFDKLTRFPRIEAAVLALMRGLLRVLRRVYRLKKQWSLRPRALLR